MKRILLVVLGAALVLGLAACSDDDSEETITLPSGGTLNGTWMTECIGLGGTDSFRLTLTFSDTSGTYTSEDWEESAECADTATYVNNGSFTYTIGEEIELPGGETVTQVNSTDTAETYTPNTEAKAAEWNDGAFYGFEDWAAGESKSVLGLDAETGEAVAVEEEKTVFAIDDSVTPNTMQIGNDDEGSPRDDDGYPEQLFDLELTKQ